MARYLQGVIAGCEANAMSYEVVQPKGSSLKAKYIDYVCMAWAKRKVGGKHLIISERYAYLLPFMGKESIVICHDLHTLYPESNTPWIHRLIYRVFLGKMQKAAKIACVSKHTKSDLLKYVPMLNGHPKIEVVYNGIEGLWSSSKNNRIDNSEFLELFNTKKVLLSVGTDAWYKNNEWSLRLLSQLDGNFHLLRIGSFNLDNQELIKELELQEKVTLAERINDAQLKYCYVNATALLFPSLTEGFGWPALEAALSNCPVISNGNGATKELQLNTIGLEHAYDYLMGKHDHHEHKESAFCSLWKNQVRELLS